MPSQAEAKRHLRVTVIATTQEGTLAALRTARNLARDLELQLALVSVKVVPYHFPVEAPPVSISFLTQHALTLVAASGAKPEETTLQVYLCRDRTQCLRQVLAPNSLVVVGGRKRWWVGQEQKLETYLRTLGHRTIFAEMNSSSDCNLNF